MIDSRYHIRIMILIAAFQAHSFQTNAQNLIMHNTPSSIDSILYSRLAESNKLDTIKGGYDGRYTSYKKILLIKTHIEKGFYYNYTLRYNKQIFYHEDNYSSTNLKTAKHTRVQFFFLDDQPVKFETIITYGDFKNPISTSKTTAYLDHGMIIQLITPNNRRTTRKKLTNFQNDINKELPRLKTNNPLLF